MLVDILNFLHTYFGWIIFTMFMCFIVFINVALKKIDKKFTLKNENIKNLEHQNAAYEKENAYYKDQAKKYKNQIKSYEEKTQEIIKSYEEKIQKEQNTQKILQLQNFKKGKEYEYQIKIYYENMGYKVFPNGYIYGKNDGGIDLIAHKEKEIRLIQTKCYTNPPKQYLIRRFIGDCEVWINENKNMIKNKKVFKDFVTSCESIDYAVSMFLQKHQNSVNYFIRKKLS